MHTVVITIECASHVEAEFVRNCVADDLSQNPLTESMTWACDIESVPEPPQMDPTDLTQFIVNPT